LTDEEQASTGVTPDLIRLCIGLETLADILADLDSGFRSAKGA
jgi:O-acetylhomoserine (thiol)-lyase